MDEHATAGAAQGPIEATGGDDLEGLHATGERAAIDGLDQQVDVIVLHADVDDAEVGAPEHVRGRRAQRAIRRRPAQPTDLGRHPEHHVDRVVP